MHHLSNMKIQLTCLPVIGHRVASTVVCIAILVGLTIGCSDSRYGSKVSGHITLDGEPVGPGVVVFVPEGSEEPPATGGIESDGSYFLVTSHHVGLQPGSYNVSVRAYEERDPPPPGEISFEDPVPIVPRKYLSVKTSGLKFDVESGSNSIDIDLSQK